MAKKQTSAWSRLDPSLPNQDYAAATLPEEDSNALIADAAVARYGQPNAKDWRKTAVNADLDMGLGRYKTKINEDVPNLTVKGEPAYGVYSPKRNTFTADKYTAPADKLATAMHEFAHLADTANGMYSYTPGATNSDSGLNNPNHHKDFVNFEGEMPLIMAAQNNIEHGLPVDPALLDRYPQLRDVRAQSSNYLAVPWKRPEIPANIWNKMRAPQ